MENRLFVGNLSAVVTDRDLVELFTPYGVVVDVKLINDRDTGRPRGFAFLTMNSGESAQAAADALDGKEFHGRPIKVNEARPKPERAPRMAGAGAGRGDYRR